MSDAHELLGLASELVAVGSVSRNETALAGLVEGELRESAALEVVRIGDNVVARTFGERPGRILLAGHLDTVPASGDPLARLEGDELTGLGAVDMKGGLAVMLDLAGALREATREATLVFYAREEIARAESGLLEIERARPDLLGADVAVLLEPTGALVECGCQGTLRVRVTLRGARAHTARPWVGRNAIHRLGAVIDAVGAYEGRRPVLDGCEYRESLQAVGVTGGVAGNVVPDEATLTLNHRFAPDRSAEEAFEAVRSLLERCLEADAGDSVVIEDVAPAAPPSLDHPLLAELVEASGASPRAKLGYTDVAFFAARGVPAANFGPGDPLLAHTPDERVSGVELVRVREALGALLASRREPR